MLTFSLVAILALTGCKDTDDENPTEQQPTTPTTEVLEPYVCGDIKRLHTYDGIFLASQPSASDLEQAAQSGIRTVINQRHDSEPSDFDERATVESLGLQYHNPAWNGPDELSDEIIDETRELLRTAPRPILLHCGSANRAGAIWLAYRALDGGVDIEAAATEARTVGLKSTEYEEIVRDYIDRHR